MTLIGWAEIALVLGLVALAAFPLGAYIARVLNNGRTQLTPLLTPVETGCYRLAGIDPARGMSWRQYAVALVVLNAVHFLLLYAILRAQYYLPFNPQHLPGLAPRTAFNTAMSFVTNTNWQAYSGEITMSHGSQMFGLTVHNFLSAATGISAAAAVARAFSRGGMQELGNFWTDLTRITLYLLLPLTIVVGILLLASGVPDTLSAAIHATTLEGAQQTIAIGPVAFQEAIKDLGTNGGGFFNANSAHPFENPTAVTSMIECWSLAVIPFALAIAFGHIVGDTRQGRALFLTMAVLVVAAVLACYAAEAAGNPLLTKLGVDPAMGNMEGKEVRFGTPLSIAVRRADHRHLLRRRQCDA